MDPSRFDDLVRSFAATASRRILLAGLLGSLAPFLEAGASKDGDRDRRRGNRGGGGLHGVSAEKKRKRKRKKKRPTAQTACPPCGACRTCSLDEGLCSDGCGGGCPAAALCHDARAFPDFRRLTDHLAERGYRALAEPTAYAVEQGGQRVRSVLAGDFAHPNRLGESVLLAYAREASGEAAAYAVVTQGGSIDHILVVTEGAVSPVHLTADAAFARPRRERDARPRRLVAEGPAEAFTRCNVCRAGCELLVEFACSEVLVLVCGGIGGPLGVFFCWEAVNRVCKEAPSAGACDACGVLFCCDQPCANQANCCDGLCVNLAADLQNCGACGNDCGTDVFARCCNGTCRNTRLDNDNCGACGRRCPAGAVCRDGQCVCPGNGPVCGTLCCAEDELCCKSGDGQADACVPLLPDPDTQCRACVDGREARLVPCGDVCCPQGKACCGEQCVDTDIDEDNCGICGRECANCQICDEGACRTFATTYPSCEGCVGGEVVKRTVCDGYCCTAPAACYGNRCCTPQNQRIVEDEDSPYYGKRCCLNCNPQTCSCVLVE